MLEDTRFDAQISALYLAGTNAIEIARRLDLRVPEVIGRIRAQDLKPVGMAERRAAAQPAATEPTPAPAPVEAAAETPAVESRVAAEPVQLRRAEADKAAPARPGNRPSARPAIAGNTALKQQVDADDDDEDDEEDERVVRFTGRPKGWLISETRLNEMYARMGRGY